MAGGHERRTKRRFDSGGANQRESSSSRTNVVSGRELRPRERKRAATTDIDDIVLESEGGSYSDEDDVVDSPYRVEQRSGKAPADENSSEEEEEAAGDDEEEEESEEREENLTYPIIQRPVRLGSRKCVDYYGKGMTREVKRWRSIDPYPEAKNAVDPRFHTLFQ